MSLISPAAPQVGSSGDTVFLCPLFNGAFRGWRGDSAEHGRRRFLDPAYFPNALAGGLLRPARNYAGPRCEIRLFRVAVGGSSTLRGGRLSPIKPEKSPGYCDGQSRHQDHTPQIHNRHRTGLPVVFVACERRPCQRRQCAVTSRVARRRRSVRSACRPCADPAPAKPFHRAASRRERGAVVAPWQYVVISSDRQLCERIWPIVTGGKVCRARGSLGGRFAECGFSSGNRTD
jgi:hypothetical protein